MTRDEARRIAEDVASDLVLHDLPKRLHKHVDGIWLNALIKATGRLVAEGVMEYLTQFEIEPKEV